MRVNLKGLLSLFAITTAVCFTPMASANGWSFEIEPYAMATSIDGDASVGRVTGADVDVDFDAILENLELAAMVHFEAQHESGWGVILDYGFMDLAADISSARGGVIDAEVHQGVFEALVSKRFQVDGDQHVDLTAGIRWWDNDIDVVVDPAVLPGTFVFDVEEDWVDVVIGARWVKPMNDAWSLHVQADVGGFGLESDFTASAALGVSYRFSDRYALDMRYKGTWVDYESGSRGTANQFGYDTLTHGPIIGLIVNF